MSARLIALNLALRLIEKPHLARTNDVQTARSRFESAARRWFVSPLGMHSQSGPLGGLDALWVSCDRPIRKRVLLYLHGGAFVQGSSATHMALAAALAGRARARAVIPEYRLAPEHPFPAACDDVLTCYRALLDRGYEPGQIGVAGDSAGGGLVFSLLHLIASNRLPMPAGVIAFSPWADLRLVGESLTRNARRDVLIPAGRLSEIRDLYLNGADPEDPRASPVLGRLEGAPPTLIQASRAELLESDARIMGETLTEQGRHVRTVFWRSTPHVWQIFQGRLREADHALDDAGTFLLNAFNEIRAD